MRPMSKSMDGIEEEGKALLNAFIENELSLEQVDGLMRRLANERTLCRDLAEKLYFEALQLERTQEGKSAN